jgi:hypothetical protein
MMPFLYINSKGEKQIRNSYSGGNLFRSCPLKYKLQKIDGWREIESKARFLFGQALEDAIQWHHEHEGEGAIECFVKDWQTHADKKLTFTKVEKDWATLYKTGVEMIKLYKIVQPTLPIPMGGRSLFQIKKEKEVFPGDPNYGGILDIGKLDIVCYNPPDHPMLPRVDWKPEYGPFRPLVVDIKTSGVDFPEQYGLAGDDIQLRRYSWHSDIRDVALLIFVKKSHNLKKGSKVTLLEPSGVFVAGQKLIIALIEEEKIIVLANEAMVGEMEKAQGFVTNKNGKQQLEQTKDAKERRSLWLEKYGAIVKAEQVTKQKIQFNAGFVTAESANDAGQIAGNQIIEIVNAWHRKCYPNEFGIRYPVDSTSDPYYRAFVMGGGGDLEYRKANFTQVSEESLDDLFKDDEGETDGEDN